MRYYSNIIQVGDVNVATFVHNRPFDPVYGLRRTEEDLRTTGVLIDPADVEELPPKAGCYVAYVCDIAAQTITPIYITIPSNDEVKPSE